MKDKLRQLVEEALKSAGLAVPAFSVEFPADDSHGDYATNVAMVLAKQEGKNPTLPEATSRRSPRELAESVKSKLLEVMDADIKDISIAGPGFINFKLSDSYYTNVLKDILDSGGDYGKGGYYDGQKVMCEYTDPNPFKVFHIGHLVPNAIGEAVSRLIEFSGAKMHRMVYQGDVGMQVARSVWGMRELASETPDESAPLAEKTAFLGKCYAFGTQKAEESEDIVAEQTTINKAIYERSDEAINALYDKGRAWSMDHFEEIYKLLGTKFDHYTPESSVWKLGVEEVKAHPEVFAESDGAYIFRGEEHGLHTRVFLNSKGLPTYEAKDLGLVKKKFELVPDLDLSVTVTGMEQKEYFKVVKKALSMYAPERAEKVVILNNGLLSLSSGKMSSRTGNVVTGESLIADMQSAAKEKMAERDELSENEREEVGNAIAVAAIKYGILKQAIGKNFVFDQEAALSFEGDSGPYLQYTHARARSLIRKGSEQGVTPAVGELGESEISVLRLLSRFPLVVETAAINYAPQQMVTYLTELASAFNSYYGANQVIDDNNKDNSAVRLALVEAVANTLKNGLWTIGCASPERM